MLDFLSFGYIESGRSLSWMQGWRHTEVFTEGHFCVTYSPTMSGFSEYRERMPSRGQGIQVGLDTFRHFISKDPRREIQQLFAPVLSDSPQALLISGRMTSQMKCLLDNVQKATTTFEHQARIYELLDLTLDAMLHQSGFKETALRLTPEDIERLEAVKYILARQLQAPPTLVELARQIGLNDFKLKKGFKYLNQKTVFEYLHDLRMQKAARLLIEQTGPIIDVAYQVGYSNHGHFSVAFKKYFGRSPSKFRS